MAYFAEGAISAARVAENTLKARCFGSQPTAYQLQVTLGPAGIVFAGCSCPVGDGGHCKHIAALLLTWVDDPDSFTKIDELAASLEKRSKAELIAIIQRMIQREPDLEMLLELPLPGIEAVEKPLDAQVIRRQVEHAFRSSHGDQDWGWGDPAEVAAELQSLFDLAGKYQDQNRPGDAATIYQIVVETILDYENMVMQDEHGHLSGSIDECAEGLGDCLDAISEVSQRVSILKTLFDIFAWDVKAGGIGIGEGVLESFLDEITAQEKQLISGWIQSTLPSLSGWALQTMGELLLALLEDTIDDEAFLQICRQTGQVDELVDRLLDLKRTDEAVGETQQAGDYNLPRLADLFVRHGLAPLAEDLMRERAANSRDTRLTGWLKEHAKKKGDLKQALAYAEQEFWQHPQVSMYVEMRQLAAGLEGWLALRTKTLERIAQTKDDRLLIEIFLEEGEIDQALETLERVRASPRLWRIDDLQEQVARAAIIQRPRQAIQLYLQLIEQLVKLRGRGNYAQAIVHLRTVREIYLRLGEAQAWQAVIARLRDLHRKLPALQDELDRAGL